MKDFTPHNILLKLSAFGYTSTEYGVADPAALRGRRFNAKCGTLKTMYITIKGTKSLFRLKRWQRDELQKGLPEWGRVVIYYTIAGAKLGEEDIRGGATNGI